ncbi:hypothetical protein BMI88_10830 [Thioclava sp. F36-6]|nr:hypothetical protein BMI88_10830 [Thioclava sp. F36-6]
MFRVSILGLAALSLVGCKDNGTVFTLYRASPISATMRIHMATFDADEPDPTYNLDNCQLTARLFMSQPGVSVRYWCEPGRYRE